MAITPDRKHGKLTGRFRVEAYYKGERRRGRTNTLAEAKALEAALLREMKTGVPAPVIKLTTTPQGTTLKEAREKAKGILWDGQSTALSSFKKLDRILSIWGDSSVVDDIDANRIDELVQALKAKESSEATINRYLSCVSAFLKFCKARGHRKRELPPLDWRREDEGRIRWLTYEEEDEIMRLLPEPFATLVYIDLRTGLRAAELQSLKPEQVTPKAIHLWRTKNGSARTVPINKELYDLLWPLVSEEGRMPDYWQFRFQWDKARKAMGLQNDPTFVFHACRHTYATRAIEAGVNIRVLQKLMGHKTIQTTLRYAHVADSTLVDAAEKMFAFHARGGVQRVG